MRPRGGGSGPSGGGPRCGRRVVYRRGAEAVEEGATMNENDRTTVIESEPEPEDVYMTDEEFRRAFAAVLKREDRVFRGLADYNKRR